MGKIAVVYQSKNGSTAQYAKWIAEETGADLFTVDSCKVSDLADYDTIVYGGWIRVGGVQGIEFLKKNFKALGHKKIITFAVGLNIHHPAAQKECREINFVKQLKEIPCYYFRGAYDPSKIKGMDKMMMGVMQKMMDDSNPELRHAIEHGADYVDRAQIKEIVEAILA